MEIRVKYVATFFWRQEGNNSSNNSLKAVCIHNMLFVHVFMLAKSTGQIFIKVPKMFIWIALPCIFIKIIYIYYY